jgi:hypothetical protein
MLLVFLGLVMIGKMLWSPSEKHNFEVRSLYQMLGKD